MRAAGPWLIGLVLGCTVGPGRDDLAVHNLRVRLCEQLQACGCFNAEDSDCETLVRPVDQTDEPTLAFDPACFARLEALVAETSCSPTPAVTRRDLCPLYHGTLFEGQACSFEIEPGQPDMEPERCGRGLLCIGGRCQDPSSVTFGTQGAPCGFEGCDETLACIAGICQVPPAAGSPCIDGECGPTAVCVPEPDNPEGACVALLEVDAPCNGHDECISGNCPAGRCRPPAGEGAECNGSLPCGPGHVCVESACQAEAEGMCLGLAILVNVVGQ